MITIDQMQTMLPPTQYQCVVLAAQGLSNKVIGRVVDKSEASVKSYLKRAFALSGVRRRAELVPLFKDVPLDTQVVQLSNRNAQAEALMREGFFMSVLPDSTVFRLLELLGAGHSPIEISERLNLSLGYVRTLIKRCLAASNAHSRTRLSREWLTWRATQKAEAVPCSVS